MAVLADFGAELHLPSGPVWRIYGDDGWLAPANGLIVGTDNNSKPLAHLSLTRAALPGRPPDPFAMLDVTVVTTRDLDAALTDLRDTQPGATLTRLVPDACQIHLGDPLLSGPGGDRIDMLSSGQSRMIRQLGWDGGLALEAMLQNGVNPLILSGAAGFAGISPRVGAVVGFDSALIPALQSRLPGQVFTRDDLASVLLAGLDALPITGTDGITGIFRTALCSTLADRIYDSLTEPLGANTSFHPIARLATGGIAPVTWDLLTPYRTIRWLPLSATDDSPLDRHLAQQGAAGIVTRSVLPVFPRSHHRLECHLNFPPAAAGVHALGVSVQAPAHPPHRPATANVSGVLDPDAGTLPLTLKLSPGEPLDYTLSCFCVVDTASGVQQFFGRPQQRQDAVIILSPADFGVQIHRITAAQHLLDLAALHLTCTYATAGQPVTQEISLSNTGAAVIVPLDATAGTMSLTATEHATGAVRTLPPMALRGTEVSAHLIPGYGPQTATITWGTPDGATLGLEVLPGAAGNTELQTFAFNAATPTRSYRYLAVSPFASGFRYRRLGTGAWQYHADPGTPLLL